MSGQNMRRMNVPEKSKRGIGGVLRELFAYAQNMKLPMAVALLFAAVGAILTIVGYSINATIVIFDRLRENLKTKEPSQTIEEIVDRSVTQTLTRSINTSLTTFIMVFVLYLMGVSSIREFALPLMVGIVCGTYSSVCLASSMWYEFDKRRGKKAAAGK